MDVIKYQCTYCNTLYDSVECCPSCGATVKNAIEINLTQNVKGRKKEIGWDTYFYPIYKIFFIVHFITAISWFGFWLSIPTTILHIIHIVVSVKRKSNNTYGKVVEPSKVKRIILCIIKIIDMVICVPSFLAMFAILVYGIYAAIFL